MTQITTSLFHLFFFPSTQTHTLFYYFLYCNLSNSLTLSLQPNKGQMEAQVYLNQGSNYRSSEKAAKEASILSTSQPEDRECMGCCLTQSTASTSEDQQLISSSNSLTPAHILISSTVTTGRTLSSDSVTAPDLSPSNPSKIDLGLR
jgi:hypothetical protein